MKTFIALLLCALALPARAEEAAPPPAADWEQLRAQAADLRQQAKQMHLQADQAHADAEALCREKFLMAGCLEDARKARQEAERAVRRVDLEAADIERRIRVHEHEARLQRHAEREREQQARAAERAGQIRQAEERYRQRLEKKQAEEVRRQQKAKRD